MNNLRMIARTALFALTLCAGLVHAEPVADGAKTSAKDSKAAATKQKVNSNGLVGQTDVVVNKDLPMVANILSWQEKEGSIPKDMLEFSALKDSLTPTDRDRLASEIRYTAILNQPTPR
jgi:hypothetical protein